MDMTLKPLFDCESQERVESAMSELMNVEAQLHVALLALDNLCDPKTNRIRSDASPADYAALRKMLRGVSGTLMIQVNELETMPVMSER